MNPIPREQDRRDDAYAIAREHILWAINQGLSTFEITKAVGCDLSSMPVEMMVDLYAIKWQGLHAPLARAA